MYRNQDKVIISGQHKQFYLLTAAATAGRKKSTDAQIQCDVSLPSKLYF